MWNLYTKVDNRRKTMVVSVSWAQLGQDALCRNDVWITVAVARTHGVIDQVTGGWSAMARALLEDVLLGPLGVATVGSPVTAHAREKGS